MQLLTEDKLEAAIEYAGKDTANCVYLYIDLTDYGIHDPNVTVWYEENDAGEFEILVLKYYDCFQVYSHYDECNLTGLVELINEYQISRVFSRKGIIDRLQVEFERDYDVYFGKVIELSKYKKLDYEDFVEEASLEDLEEIEELLLKDEKLALSYKKGELLKEFTDRLKADKGVNYIIKKDNKIVAHTCIAARTDRFKVFAYTVVEKEARDFPYGAFIDSFLMNEFVEEGIKLYCFMEDDRRIRLFEAMGNHVAAEYGKLIKKQ